MGSAEDKQRWYRRFLSKRTVPFGRRIENTKQSEGFALELRLVQLSSFKPENGYHLNIFFFDSKQNEFFGGNCQTNPYRIQEQFLVIEEELFFHCPVTAGVYIVIEIVESYRPQDRTEAEVTVGWTMLAIGESHQPLPYYGSHSELPPTRLSVYPGSPKYLLVSSSLGDLPTLNGSAHLLLLSHPTLSRVFDFFPEYSLVSPHHHIPGIREDEEGVCLGTATANEREMVTLDKIGLSFASDNISADQMMESLVDDDKAFRLNKIDPEDKMQILERRLRIGVHNGLAYIAEPLVVHLLSGEDQLTGTQTLRRKARPPSTTLKTPTSDSSASPAALVVLHRLSLPVVRHPEIALVFALDYLLGVRRRDGTTSDSQSVMIAWGICLPFSPSSTSPFSCLLHGGPRPNPEESLCFKNLLAMSRRDSGSLFPTATPSISLHFNILLQGDAPFLAPATAPVIGPSTLKKEREVEEEEEGRPSPRHSPSPLPTEEVVDGVEGELLQPMAAAQEQTTRGGSDRRGKQSARQASHGLDSTDKKWDIAASCCMVNRSSLAYLSSIKFTRVVDRNGDSPVLVDVTDKREVDLAVEGNDRLASHEIILQFLAVKWISPSTIPTSRLFFTFQFFRFSMITTERLLVSDKKESVSILKRIDDYGRMADEHPNGFTAKLTVERASLSSAREFATFLAQHSLSIEVWDADSLLLLGTASLPLRALCRRGREGVQLYAECAIVQSSLPCPSFPQGQLFLRAANIGHPFSNQLDLLRSGNEAISVNSLGSSSEQTKGRRGMVVRAAPLPTSSKSTLHRFLQSQRIDMHRRYTELFNADSVEKIREWQTLRTKIPPITHEATLKRFIFEEELEAYRKARRESKASKLLSAVFKGITLSHHLVVSLGEVHVFLFVLSNPSPHPINCILHLDSPTLSVLMDMDELSAWHKTEQFTATVESSPVGLQRRDGGLEIFLRPHESLNVPFKYDDMSTAAMAAREEEESKIIFKRSDSGEPVSILDLHINRRPFALSRLLRFMADEGSNFDRRIRIPTVAGMSRATAIRCSDPSAKVSLVNGSGVTQYLQVTVFSGVAGSIRTLLLFLYSDSFCHRLLSTWQIVIHSLCRLDAHSIQGQTSRLTLHLPPDRDPLVPLRVFSSSPCICCTAQQPVLLGRETTRLALLFTPDFTGNRVSLLSVVGEDNSLLACLVYSLVQQPHISSQFHLSISLPQTVPLIKRLPIHNRYALPSEMRLLSSRPSLMVPESEMLSLLPLSTENALFHFLPVINRACNLEILLFIQSADTGQEEETYSIRISYI